MKTLHFLNLLITLVIFSFISYLPAQAQKDTIKWYLQMSHEDADPMSGFMQYVQMYNESQDRIELTIVPSFAGCSFDATDTLLMNIEAGDPPDIVGLVYSEVWEHLMDLTPYLSLYDLSNVDSAYFFKYKKDGKMLIMPIGINLDVLYYNEDMYDSAGLAYPPHTYEENYAGGDTWNIDKFEEIAMKLTLDDKDSNAYSEDFDNQNIRQFGFHPWWINGISYTKMFGFPRIVGPDSSINVPDYTRLGLKWQQDGIWEKRFIPNGQEHEDMGADPMGSGMVAMSYTYSSYSGTIDEASFNWNIAAPPSFNGEINIPYYLSSFGILNTCQHPEKAMEVIFTIANTIPYYGTTIPVFKNLRQAVLDSLIFELPEVDWQVMMDGLNYIDANTCDGDALSNNMAAWRMANELRDNIQWDPNFDINSALNNYYIPEWDAIFNPEVPDEPTLLRDNEENGSKVSDDWFQCYPNPADRFVTFEFDLPYSENVLLTFYNQVGQEIETIVNNNYQSGKHRLAWETDNLTAGFYFIRLQIGRNVETRKLIICR
jgi:ABC-type glycerol-3-phosphate transport system substrate-binding protein